MTLDVSGHPSHQGNQTKYLQIGGCLTHGLQQQRPVVEVSLSLIRDIVWRSFTINGENRYPTPIIYMNSTIHNCSLGLQQHLGVSYTCRKGVWGSQRIYRMWNYSMRYLFVNMTMKLLFNTTENWEMVVQLSASIVVIGNL